MRIILIDTREFSARIIQALSRNKRINPHVVLEELIHTLVRIHGRITIEDREQIAHAGATLEQLFATQRSDQSALMTPRHLFCRRLQLYWNWTRHAVSAD